MRLYQVRKVSYDETVPSQESKLSCICVGGIDFAYLYDFYIEFGTVPTVVFFVCFSFYIFILISCTFYVVIANIMMYFKNS